MNRTLLVTLASLALALPAVAQSSSTPVIGFYKFDVPSGQSAWACNFVAKKEFQGAMTSMAAGANLPDGDPTVVITQTGATWTSGAFNETVYNAGQAQEVHVPKFYVELLSGTAEGRILDVVSNTGTTIRVAGAIPAGTTTYCIRAHATVGDIFAGGAGLLPFEDQVQVFFGNGASAIMSYDGANWSDISGNLAWAPNDDLPVYPGQGFLISASEARVVTFGGGKVSYVKTGPTRINLYQAAEQNLVCPLNPLVSTNSGDAIFNTDAIKTPDQFGLGTALEPFVDTAIRYSMDGNLAALAVYTSDGLNASEISGAPPPDVFRNGLPAKIELNGSSSAVEIALPQNFPNP